MRILQLCKKFPYPLKDGESIAVSSMSRALADLDCEVTLLAMNTSKHFSKLEDLPADYNQYKSIHTVDLDNKIRPWSAFKNIFSKESFHISRYECKVFEQKLIEVLKNEEFDIVQLETLYMTPYIPIIKKHSDAIVSMRAHNVEFEIWERLTKNTSFFPTKIYLEHLTQKLKSYELNHLNDYDYLVTVSERDLKAFKRLGYKNGAMSSPIGLPLKKYQNNQTAGPKGICFIGSLDWKPNEEGLVWFIKEVLPLITKKRPGTKLHIAGRNSSSSINAAMNKDVVMHGEVDSAIDFINDGKLMVVPLFSGSGTRVKILEGLALSKAIVTTPIGLEGINAQNNQHLLIEEKPAAFANAVLKLLEDETLRTKLGKEGNAFVKGQYDNLENAKTLLATYKSLMVKYSKTAKVVS